MPDYSKMYHELFNAVTNSIEPLVQAQRNTEEMYISAKQPAIIALPQLDKEKNEDSAPE